MKKFISFVFAFLFVLGCSTVRAEVMDFPHFTIDVPESWSASSANDVVGLVSKDGTASVSIAIGEVKNHSLHDLAVHFSSLLQGSEPEQNDAGYYTFTFKNDKGLESRAGMGASPHTFVLVTMTGEHPEMEPMLKTIQEK